MGQRELMISETHGNIGTRGRAPAEQSELLPPVAVGLLDVSERHMGNPAGVQGFRVLRARGDHPVEDLESGSVPAQGGQRFTLQRQSVQRVGVKLQGAFIVGQREVRLPVGEIGIPAREVRQGEFLERLQNPRIGDDLGGMRSLLAKHEVPVRGPWPPGLPEPAGLLVFRGRRGHVAAHVEGLGFGLDRIRKARSDLDRLPEQADGCLAVTGTKECRCTQEEMFRFTAVAARDPLVCRLPPPRTERLSQASRQAQQHP